MSKIRRMIKYVVFLLGFFTCTAVVDRKKKDYKTTLFGGLSLFFSVCSYTIYKFNQRPVNTPKHYLKTKRSLKPSVVCLGDSNTQGAMSYSFVNELSVSAKGSYFEIINAGINGDLAYNVLNRLDEVIACNPNYITILIGSNDILATLNKQNELRFERKKDLPIKPNEVWFESNLTAIISTLKQKTKAKIAILSLPLISENPESLAYKKSISYSKIIAKIAKCEQICYLPLNECQLQYLTNHHKAKPKGYDSSLLVFFKPAFKHYVLGKTWDEISKEEGLTLTIDTVHQNKVAATMIERLVLQFLKEEEGL
ncbi:MAG: SGNH/GDSL hydrolase family protein [Turicibacter sp.]